MSDEVRRDPAYQPNLEYDPTEEYKDADVAEISELWWGGFSTLDKDSIQYQRAERYIMYLLALSPETSDIDAEDLRLIMESLDFIGVENPHEEGPPNSIQQYQHEQWNKIQNFANLIGRQLVRATLVDSRAFVKIRNEQERAGTDHLTGVWNRLGVERELEARLYITGSPERRGSTGDTLPPANLTHLYFDANRFKWINILGHHIGDAAIQETAWEAEDLLRDSDVRIFYRHGGDEFGAILENLTEDDAAALMQRIAARQTEKAKSKLYHDSMLAIVERVRAVKKSGGIVRATARKRPLTKAEVEAGKRPYHTLYINGAAVTELRHIITLAVGAAMGLVSNTNDVELRRRDAEAAMKVSKHTFEAILREPYEIDIETRGV